MRIFIVIAVFNRKEFTLQCLLMLKHQTYRNFGIVVVDDGSTDGTSEEIQRYYPDVVLVKGDGNWWWTKSMNRGVQKAIEHGADAVITMNNDTQFNAKLIEDLVTLHQQKPKALIGSLNVIKKEQEYIFFSGLKDIVWWKAKEVKYHKSFSLLQNDLTGLHPTRCLNGRGTLIPVSVFQEIGGYDEVNFPQYASDYDLTLQAYEHGYPAFMSYDVRVFSFVEETGEGKSFIKQSWSTFFKSFTNPYSTTSLKMWRKYYFKHASKGAKSIGFVVQILRTILAFARKRNMLIKIR